MMTLVRCYPPLHTDYLLLILLCEPVIYVNFVKMFRDLTNLDLFVKLKVAGSIKDSNFLYNTIRSKLSDLNVDNDKKLKDFCAKYCYNINKKWVIANRKEEVFKRKYSEWLESEITWPDFMRAFVDNDDESVPSTSTQFVTSSPVKVSVGTSTEVRPRKPFTELGPKQKKMTR